MIHPYSSGLGLAACNDGAKSRRMAERAKPYEGAMERCGMPANYATICYLVLLVTISQVHDHRAEPGFRPSSSSFLQPPWAMEAWASTSVAGSGVPRTEIVDWPTATENARTYDVNRRGLI